MLLWRKAPLWRSKNNPRKLHLQMLLPSSVLFFSKGVESSEKEDGRKGKGEVDDELFQREFVILALENVLVEGVEGDDCADVLDVLGR